MYNGSLNINKMNFVQKSAYRSWKNARDRCNRQKNNGFLHYGAKGIRVIYSSRDFISWYEKEWNKRKFWSRPNVSRIDHSKNYSFDNIELIECSENVKERNDRHGNPTKSDKVIAKNIATGEETIFPSKRELCRILGVSRHTLKNQLKHKIKRKPACGWLFREK